MSDAGDDKVKAATERTERYRQQARYVATLTAAAAGALAAGLVLQQSFALPEPTRVLGWLSIGFLIVATASFVTASVVHARTPREGVSKKQVPLFLRPWEARFTAEANEQAGLASDTFLGRSPKVLSLIMRFIDAGMWSSAVGILCLLVSLGVAVFTPPARTTVEIQQVSSKYWAACPSLPAAFQASVSTADLENDGRYLEVDVSGASCFGKSGRPMILIMDRANLLVSVRSG